MSTEKEETHGHQKLRTSAKLLSTSPARNPQTEPRRKPRQKKEQNYCKKKKQKHTHDFTTRARDANSHLRDISCLPSGRTISNRISHTHANFAMINCWLLSRARPGGISGRAGGLARCVPPAKRPS